MINKLSSPHVFAGRADKGSGPNRRNPPSAGTNENYDFNKRKSTQPQAGSLEGFRGLEFTSKIMELYKAGKLHPNKEELREQGKHNTETRVKKPTAKPASRKSKPSSKISTKPLSKEEMKRRLSRRALSLKYPKIALEATTQLYFDNRKRPVDDRKRVITEKDVMDKIKELTDKPGRFETATLAIKDFEEVTGEIISHTPFRIDA